MKKHIRFKNLVVLSAIFLAGYPGLLRAQDTYKVGPSADPEVKVLGTSNLHNWSLEAKSLSCSAKFNFGPGSAAQPQSLTALSLSIPVQNLKSGESLMDSRAYSAMKADKFTTITYVLSSASIVPAPKGQFLVKSTGNLTISGVTRQVAFDVSCLVNPDGSITCTGSDKLKMTDYSIKPPVFMLGALRTGDELEIDFTLVFKK